MKQWQRSTAVGLSLTERSAYRALRSANHTTSRDRDTGCSMQDRMLMTRILLVRMFVRMWTYQKHLVPRSGKQLHPLHRRTRCRAAPPGSHANRHRTPSGGPRRGPGSVGAEETASSGWCHAGAVCQQREQQAHTSGSRERRQPGPEKRCNQGPRRGGVCGMASMGYQGF